VKRAAVAAALAGMLAGSGCHAGAAAGNPAPTPISIPVPRSPAAASAGGTYQGTCHYGKVLSATVILHNTGNVGEEVQVKVTWPQAQHAPASAMRKVRLPAGGSAAVQLRTPATGPAPGIVSGCVYHVIVLGTFGRVHGSATGSQQ
jgi:hypothetical protein